MTAQTFISESAVLTKILHQCLHCRGYCPYSKASGMGHTSTAPPVHQYSQITWKPLQQRFGKCQQSLLQPLVSRSLLRLACPLPGWQRNTRRGCTTISVPKLPVKMRFPTTADVAHRSVTKHTHTCANGGNVKNAGLQDFQLLETDMDDDFWPNSVG